MPSAPSSSSATPEEVEVEGVRQFGAQHCLIPARILGDLVVGNDKRSALGFREMGKK
jgi:hypothetical protein